ncbi:type II toxin-antitoxin system VapC family toxin [Saccharomonospora iraqiensis]|uniref:type II toxin-antitoxin system VapC family toxin n=1 Tax=Saccharomonospora iraqiensis TaxID=52698 RepID=UPI0004255EF2|nr:type II toxin-antitoxin system VapC family toxin [Saccharomonospora iraqiensis]
MIYLDSSALLKLVVREAETDALRAWLGDHTDPPCSSELAKVEVTVATRRVAPDLLPTARAAIAGLDLLPLSSATITLASETEQQLRSLDALHLASALLLGDELTRFVTYDHRLASAAEAVRLTTTAPGC